MSRTKKTKATEEAPEVAPVDNSIAVGQPPAQVAAEPEMGIAKEPTPTEATVEVDAGVLQSIMDELKAGRDRLKVLEGITGENSIRSWLEGHKDNTVKRAHLKLIDGQPVVSWSRLLKNSMVKMQNGAYVEELLMHIRLLDGTTKEIRYVDFLHEQAIKMYKIMAITNDLATNKKTFTLEDELGHRIEVGEDFVNPA